MCVCTCSCAYGRIYTHTHGSMSAAGHLSYWPWSAGHLHLVGQRADALSGQTLPRARPSGRGAACCGRHSSGRSGPAFMPTCSDRLRDRPQRRWASCSGPQLPDSGLVPRRSAGLPVSQKDGGHRPWRPLRHRVAFAASKSCDP